MRKRFKTLPSKKESLLPNQSVGIIGCGNYSFSNIAYFLNKRFGRVIGACMDIDIHRAASLSNYFKVPFYTDNGEELINHKQIRMIFIASNHASHAEYAIKALLNGKDVYIEKPHVVTEDQLVRLFGAMKKSTGKVFLGFNRPVSRFGKIIYEYLSQEPGAGMYNWFVNGHLIDPDNWYFKPGEGGRILGNLCHWTDFVLRLVKEKTYPITIHPTRAEKGDGNIIVSYSFGDETLAVISFSSKGHTFEGVREKFSAHKGNCLIAMDDFKNMTIEISDVKKKYFNLYRDQGHQVNIVSAFEAVSENMPYDYQEQIAYVWNTAYLFLKTKEALDNNKEITVQSFEDTRKSLGI